MIGTGVLRTDVAVNDEPGRDKVECFGDFLPDLLHLTYIFFRFDQDLLAGQAGRQRVASGMGLFPLGLFARVADRFHLRGLLWLSDLAQFQLHLVIDICRKVTLGFLTVNMLAQIGVFVLKFDILQFECFPGEPRCFFDDLGLSHSLKVRTKIVLSSLFTHISMWMRIPFATPDRP